ncbi:MAG: metallophosphoesterase [bacterium]
MKPRHESGITRRDLLRAGAGTAAVTLMAGASPFGMVRMAFGSEKAQSFTFAYLSDAHLYVKSLNQKFVDSLVKGVQNVNDMDPPPDFVFFGGDLAQLGHPDELKLGKEILSGLKPKLHMMVGEHDWYLDMGEAWKGLFGPDRYSFDHKGIHFVVLNSVIVKDYWTPNNMTPEQRMLAMAQLDNPKGEAFSVGSEQRAWLEKDLKKVKPETPLVVFSHSPLYKLYRPWNFWTDDAEEVQKILSRFKIVTVFHGHTHQILTNRIGNITFHGFLSTAWPWPYAPTGMPKLSLQMDRPDPFFSTDGCGWGTIDMLGSGQADKTYQLWNRSPMKVTYQEIAAGTWPPAYAQGSSGPSY